MTQDNTTAPQADDSDTGKKRRAAYGAANTRLREQHREDFETLYEEECKRLGVPYKKRLNDEEKAEREMEELLAKFPNLREKVTTDLAGT